jgi:tripartite-type tricarboxylate transporter receptor subunit TctC
MMKRRWIATALVTAALTPFAWAQGQPGAAKVTRMVVPFPPGGATDVVARLLAKRMSEELGQQVIVDNRPGAGGGLGTGVVAKSEPDGNTLVFTVAGPIVAVPHVNKNIGYRMQDLAAVAMVFRSPFLLAVAADSPYRSLAELVAAGKAGPGRKPAAYGSSGIGALSHLGSEMFNLAAGTSFVHVPYKGTPGTLQALLSGDIAWALVSVNDVRPQIEGGKARPLAVLSQKRTPMYPNVPAMAETGMGKLDLDLWFGLFAPAKIAPATLDRLAQTVRKIIAEPEFVGRLRDLGGSTPTDANTPASIMVNLERESAEFQKIVQTLGIKGE